MESKKDAGRNKQKKIWLMSLNKEGGRKQISGTRMGLGRMKRKREKILLEKQTQTSTIGHIYRAGALKKLLYSIFLSRATIYYRERMENSIHKKRLQ